MASQKIPGPAWHHGVSHGTEYDDHAFTFYVTAVIQTASGPVRLRSHVRPYCESEVIHAKLRGHSPEAVLEAYGVILDEPVAPTPRRSWWRSWLT